MDKDKAYGGKRSRAIFYKLTNLVINNNKITAVINDIYNQRKTVLQNTFDNRFIVIQYSGV